MKNTTLCYIKQNNAYLMLHRTKKIGDPNAGKWIGIGGHMEDGESPEECVVREVREETGLILKEYRYRALVTFTSDLYGTEYMHLFTADKFEGSITDNCEEGELEWIESDKIMELPMWEGDRMFIPLIKDDDTGFFSMKLIYESDKLVDCDLYMY